MRDSLEANKHKKDEMNDDLTPRKSDPIIRDSIINVKNSNDE